MAFFRHTPPPPLNTYIGSLYYVDGQLPYSHEKIMPTAQLDLKINLGGVVQAYAADKSEPFATCSDSWWSGLRTEYHIVEWPVDKQYLGVSFKAGGAYPLLRLPLSELHNRVVSLDIFWGYFAAEIRERLYAAPTIEAKFVLFERLLLTRLYEVPYGFQAVQYALKELARCDGVLSIRDLSEQMGISQNYLNTQFKRLVGGTPKEVARLYRFKHVLRSIDPTQPVDWAQVAYQSYYYDQSHFNKDFMAFTGDTPTHYLQLRRRVQAENPEHSRNVGMLAID